MPQARLPTDLLYSHPQKQHFVAHAIFPCSTIISHSSIHSMFLFMSHILSFPLPSFHGCRAPGRTWRPSAKLHLLAWSGKSISALKGTCMQSKILLLYGHFGSCCTIQVKWQVFLIKTYRDFAGHLLQGKASLSLAKPQFQVHTRIHIKSLCRSETYHYLQESMDSLSLQKLRQMLKLSVSPQAGTKVVN